MSYNFVVKTRPDDVHGLRVAGGVVMSECCEIGAKGDLEHNEISIVTKPLTCDACIGERGSKELTHDDGEHCVNGDVDCMEALDKKTHYGHCHHCKAELQLPYDWRAYSPAPQISRRETY